MSRKHKIFPLSLSDELRQALKKEAAARETTVTAIIKMMIKERMAQLSVNESVEGGGFKPFATILTARSSPSPLVAAIVTDAPQLLHISLDASQPPNSFIGQALDTLAQRLAEIGSNELPFFGPPVAVVVNYGPTCAVRYNLEGQPVATLPWPVTADRGEVWIAG